jgi:hypothetical protein
MNRVFERIDRQQEADEGKELSTLVSTIRLKLKSFTRKSTGQTLF